MTFEILCPCGQKLIAQEKHIGKQKNCPKCNVVLIIPNPVVTNDVEQSDSERSKQDDLVFPSQEPNASGNEQTEPTVANDVGGDFVDSGKITVANPYVLSLRKQFEEALIRLDTEVPSLLSEKRIITSCEVFNHTIQEIGNVHRTLESIYELIAECNYTMLGHFGVSLDDEAGIEVKIEPKYVHSLAHKHSEDKPEFEREREMYRRVQRTHPLLKEEIVTEIEYMLQVLIAVAEPDWYPGKGRTSGNPPPSADEKSDTEVSQETRIAVWQRDKGRCAECSAKEEVELTFIIPPTQGGAVNEHNSRLLCGRCRIKQGARA